MSGSSLPIDTDYLVRVLRDLVCINSVNPSLVPGGAGEKAIAVYVAAALNDMGVDVHVHEHAPGRFSVVGARRGSGGGRSLMLNAHMDTVGVDGMASPFSGEIRDGRVYGRGAQDMKGSLAACMAAMKALCDARIPLSGDTLIAAVADEEYASVGSEDISRRYPVDGAIVTEPTELNICRAHKGFVWVEVETQGRAAHGSRFMEGVDANMRMGRVLSGLDQLEQALRSRPAHPLVGPPSLHAATLRGGEEWSMYAERCLLRIERRTVPGETVDQAVAEIQAIVDRIKADDPSFHATVKTVFYREPFETSADSDLVRLLENAVEQTLGRRTGHIGSSGWMDSALLSAAGAETIIIGPTGDGLHTREEWVDIPSVISLAEILTATAMRYCA